jgi:hypothetical protein
MRKSQSKEGIQETANGSDGPTRQLEQKEIAMEEMKEGDCKKQQSQMRYCKKTSHKCKRSKKQESNTQLRQLSRLSLLWILLVH